MFGAIKPSLQFQSPRENGVCTKSMGICEKNLHWLAVIAAADGKEKASYSKPRFQKGRLFRINNLQFVAVLIF